MFSGPHLPEFLLPFRKPKRIRTAFSPSQLLKLEQAFEKNQYVVGQERKELAKSLNLSETQVTAFIMIIITTSLCTVDARPATIAPSSRLNAANTTIVQICMFMAAIIPAVATLDQVLMQMTVLSEPGWSRGRMMKTSRLGRGSSGSSGAAAA